MFDWFERRIDPFIAHDMRRPPATLLAFFWHHLRTVAPVLAILLVVGIVGSLIEVALFAFLGSIIDLMRAAPDPRTFLSDHSGKLLLMAFTALVARPAVSAMHDLIKNQIINGPLTARVRYQSHAYVLRQSLNYFQNDFAGRVANRVMTAPSALVGTVVQLIDGLGYVIVQWAGTFALLAIADWRLGWPLVVWLALYILALRYFVPRIRARSTAASEARSQLMGRIVDSYTNILTVKLFAHADREDAYAREGIAEHVGKLQLQNRVITLMELTLYVLNGVLIVVVCGLAIWLWSIDRVSLGAIAMATGLTIRIVNMSGWVMGLVAGIFENIGVVQEGLQSISRDWDVVDASGARAITVERGAIRFEGVRFNYAPKAAPAPDDEADEPVIAGFRAPQRSIIGDLTLEIPAGQKVGLVGRSGAGKSTLVNLLLRFYDLSGGRILIDGQDIARVTQESLRARIGMVTQDTSLLHRSVLDNIRYGRPDASEADAVAAARKAQAHEFILGLEDGKGRRGYDAHVGERGVKLSGGQRQRIALARVLLKDAPILILDEATSALDSEAEAAIQEQLFNLMAGKTVIAIAHRLSTIAAMDRLLIMDAGRIVEDGSHEELIRKGGLYAELWSRQSGGFIVENAAE